MRLRTSQITGSGYCYFSAYSFEDVREINPSLAVLVVIPTVYTANRKIEQDVLAILQNQFGEACRPPLPNQVEYLRAYAEQRPISGELADYWNDIASYIIAKAGI